MLLQRPLSSRQWFKAMSVSCHCVTDQSARVPEQKPAYNHNNAGHNVEQQTLTRAIKDVAGDETRHQSQDDPS
jgi:hypothetical protein